MAETTRRINSAPRSAVLYVYDPNTETPSPVDPAPDSLIVIVPATYESLDEIKAFFTDAARAMGLKTRVND